MAFHLPTTHPQHEHTIHLGDTSLSFDVTQEAAASTVSLYHAIKQAPWGRLQDFDKESQPLLDVEEGSV